MEKAFQLKELAHRHRGNKQASPESRELAHYAADMLQSLRACAKAPDLRALEVLLHTAEQEAKRIARGETDSANAPSGKRIGAAAWRGARR